METQVLLRTRTLSAQMIERDLTVGGREMEFNEAECSESGVFYSRHFSCYALYSFAKGIRLLTSLTG